MSPTVQGGQHDTKYVTFELLLHVVFVADEIWGFMPELARRNFQNRVTVVINHFYCSKTRYQILILGHLLRQTGFKN